MGRPHALKGGPSQKLCLASAVSGWRYPFLRHTHLLIGPDSLLLYLNSALPSFVRPSLGCGRIVCQRYGRSIEDSCATRPPRPYVAHHPRMPATIGWCPDLLAVKIRARVRAFFHARKAIRAQGDVTRELRTAHKVCSNAQDVYAPSEMDDCPPPDVRHLPQGPTRGYALSSSVRSVQQDDQGCI